MRDATPDVSTPILDKPQFKTPEDEKFAAAPPVEIANNKPRRRICGLSLALFWTVVIGIIVVLAVALGAGLGAGLKKHSGSKSENATPSFASGSTSASSTNAVTVSSSRTSASTKSTTASSATASSTTAYSTSLQLLVATTTAAAREAISTYGTIADSFCIPDSNIIPNPIPSAEEWDILSFTSYADYTFYSTNWTDGSAGGVFIPALTDTTGSDMSSLLPSASITGTLELNEVYTIRVSFGIFLNTYNPDTNLTAVQIQLRMGSSITDDTVVIWKWSKSQADLDSAGYAQATVTLEESVLIPGHLDVSDPTSYQLSVYMSPVNQTGYIYAASIYNATDDTCSSGDPSYPLFLDSWLNPLSTESIQANSEFVGPSDDTSIAESFCVPASGMIDDARFSGDWSTSNWTVISITRTIASDKSEREFNQITWTDGSVGGVYVGAFRDSFVTDSSPSAEAVIYYDLDLALNTYYRIRYSFKPQLKSGFDQDKVCSCVSLQF